MLPVDGGWSNQGRNPVKPFEGTQKAWTLYIQSCECKDFPAQSHGLSGDKDLVSSALASAIAGLTIKSATCKSGVALVERRRRDLGIPVGRGPVHVPLTGQHLAGRSRLPAVHSVRAAAQAVPELCPAGRPVHARDQISNNAADGRNTRVTPLQSGDNTQN